MDLFRNSLGYRYLDAFVLANIIELGTVHFCRQNLTLQNDPGGRTYSQMTHAARSGCRNFAEGSERLMTSYSSATTLIDVARASLCELRDDYNKWLMLHRTVPWAKNSADAQRIYNIRLDKPDYGKDLNSEFCRHVLSQYQKFEPELSSDDSLVSSNVLIVILQRTILMTDKYIRRLGEEFAETGSFRERMNDVRTKARSQQAGQTDSGPACPQCGSATLQRRTKKDNRLFWGCSEYPACRGIVNV